MLVCVRPDSHVLPLLGLSDAECLDFLFVTQVSRLALSQSLGEQSVPEATLKQGGIENIEKEVVFSTCQAAVATEISH